MRGLRTLAKGDAGNQFKIRDLINSLVVSVNKLKGDPDGDGLGETTIPANVYPVADGAGGLLAGDVKHTQIKDTQYLDGISFGHSYGIGFGQSGFEDNPCGVGGYQTTRIILHAETDGTGGDNVFFNDGDSIPNTFNNYETVIDYIKAATGELDWRKPSMYILNMKFIGIKQTPRSANGLHEAIMIKYTDAVLYSYVNDTDYYVTLVGPTSGVGLTSRTVVELTPSNTEFTSAIMSNDLAFVVGSSAPLTNINHAIIELSPKLVNRYPANWIGIIDIAKVSTLKP